MAASIGRIALNGTKSAMRFIGGAWSQPVGKAMHEAHKSGVSLLDFSRWKKEYCDYFAKAATKTAEVAGNATNKSGFWSGVTNVLGKIPGLKFLGRNIGPIIMFGPMLITAFNEMKEGGIVSGVKELLKGGIGWAGWSVGMAAAFAFGFSGFWIPMVFGFAVSTIADWGAKKVLGPSIAEQKAELAQKQQQMQIPQGIQQKGEKVDLERLDKNFREMQRIFNNRNNQNPFAMMQGVNDGSRRTFVA